MSFVFASRNISHGQMHAVMMQAKSNQFKNSSTGFRGEWIYSQDYICTWFLQRF